MWAIPIISAILYLIGGQIWKPARWLMGIPIAIVGVYHQCFWAILAIPAYWVATSAFPYGEKSWLNFLGERGKFFVAGLVFGLCSFTYLSLPFALSQSILSAVSFLILKILDDKDMLKNPWQELLRGLLGTICYIGG